MESIILMTLSLCILSQLTNRVEAGFEQSCTYDDYYGGRINPNRLSRCGRSLTDFVVSRCGGNVNLGSDHGRNRREIMLSKEEANSYLRPKRSSDSMRQGIVCECCIHGCNVNELQEYCENKRRRRSVRDIITGAPGTPVTYFTEAEVEEVYREIDEETEKAAAPAILSGEDIRKMEMIEHVKLENIERKLENVKASMPADVNIDIPSPLVTSSSSTHHRRAESLDMGSLLANSVNVRHHRRHKSHSS